MFALDLSEGSKIKRTSPPLIQFESLNFFSIIEINAFKIQRLGRHVGAVVSDVTSL